jgi:hypothetical protein
MSELRKEVETEMGVTPAKPAKVGRRIPTFEQHEAPSHWRKTLKAWGIFFLSVFVVSLLSGIIVGLLQRSL